MLTQFAPPLLHPFPYFLESLTKSMLAIFSGEKGFFLGVLRTYVHTYMEKKRGFRNTDVFFSDLHCMHACRQAAESKRKMRKKIGCPCMETAGSRKRKKERCTKKIYRSSFIIEEKHTWIVIVSFRMPSKIGG